MKLSFLTGCMNRLNHLQKTYLANIENSKATENCSVEFVLLNYNSEDNLDIWVNENIRPLPIDFKYLKTNKPKFYSPSIVKNILGKSATGDLLCWLDADNFTYDGFVDYVHEIFYLNKNQIVNVSWSEKAAGTLGRVICSKKHFLKVRGYDESFTGWGYEDVDFVERVKRLGCKRIELNKKYASAIQHSEKDRVSKYNPIHVKRISENDPNANMKYESNLLNFYKSKKNLNANKIVANLKPSWGLL